MLSARALQWHRCGLPMHPDPRSPQNYDVEESSGQKAVLMSIGCTQATLRSNRLLWRCLGLIVLVLRRNAHPHLPGGRAARLSCKDRFRPCRGSMRKQRGHGHVSGDVASNAAEDHFAEAGVAVGAKNQQIRLFRINTRQNVLGDAVLARHGAVHFGL